MSYEYHSESDSLMPEESIRSSKILEVLQQRPGKFGLLRMTDF
jgi:hypothetical protein